MAKYLFATIIRTRLLCSRNLVIGTIIRTRSLRSRNLVIGTIIAFFLFGLLLLSPSAALAAYNTVTFADDATTSLWGIPLDLTIASGSEVESLEVNSANLVAVMLSGSNITITDSTRKVLSNSENIAVTCTSQYSRITYSTNNTKTLTVTPSADTCGLAAPSTAGPSYAPPPAATTVTTTEEEEEEAEEEPTVEALPTETAAAEDVAVTAAEGGSAEATTEDGTRATLELPADAVTADVTVDITPVDITPSATVEAEVTAAEAVAVEVAAVPVVQNIVGGHVYDYSVSAAGEAVSTFAEPVTVTFTYTSLQVSGLNESTLRIAYYDETTSAWVELETTVDSANNKVTATVDHLTLFALLGEEAPEEEEEEEVVTPISEMTIAELKAEIARIAALIAQLQQELLNLIAAEGGQQLTQNLMLGVSSDEVELLQTWLALDASVYPEGIVSGWFGPLTKAAVIKFQEKYHEDVLAPWNFTKGTGYVGSTTRAKLNALYGGQ